MTLPQTTITPAAIIQTLAARHKLFLPRGRVQPVANSPFVRITIEPILHKVSPVTLIAWFDQAGATVLAVKSTVEDRVVVEEMVTFRVKA